MCRHTWRHRIGCDLRLFPILAKHVRLGQLLMRRSGTLLHVDRLRQLRAGLFAERAGANVAFRRDSG